MGLKKYKLGDLVYELDRRNDKQEYGIECVRGISNAKEIMETKAEVDKNVIYKFYVVMQGEFVYNPRTTRMGNKVGLAYNNTNKPLLFSFNNIAFAVDEKAKEIILPDYLYLYFNRSEFDRYAMINSWGSATELFSFEEMCDIGIELPPIEVQQKYVDIYNAMVENQKVYERGLEDLKLSIDAIMDKWKHSEKRKPVGELLEEVDIRNIDGKYKTAQGINIAKRFMPSVASSEDLLRYKVVQKNQFAYSSMQTGRDECIRIALLQEDMPIIVSPAYSVLQRKRDDILEEYIQMWFLRDESDRRGWFMSDSSIRANLDLPRFYEIEIPIPNIEKQKALVKIYRAYVMRYEINEKLKQKIKDLCPILIKGSLQ